VGDHGRTLERDGGDRRVEPAEEHGAIRWEDPATVAWSTLTPAERRVVVLVAEGLTNASIARRLSLSRYTVETHLKHVFSKLRVTSRAALAAETVRRNAAGS
jgi:DNA-binding CsgD family transcriptional regulator